MNHQRWTGLAMIVACGLLSACTTAVKFTSEPTGATVTYLGAVIGKTPFETSIDDQFGWFSVYSFTATLDGYKPTTIDFPELTPLDAQLVVPPKVNFILKR